MPPTAVGREFLQDRATIARDTAVKPIVLEEFGEPTPNDKDFNTWIGAAESNDYSGIQPWQMVDTMIGGYDFGYGGEVGLVIRNMCGHQAGL